MFWVFLIVLVVCSTVVSIVAMKTKHLTRETYSEKRALLERRRAELQARTWDFNAPRQVEDLDKQILALIEQMPSEDDED